MGLTDFPVHVPAVCGQIQACFLPVASVITLISAGCTIRASLLPPGDTARPARSREVTEPAVGRAASRAVRVRGAKASRKNTTAVALSRCWAAKPPVPEVMGHQR